MIRRLRHPDGTNHDVDHGPGPVGRMVMPGRRRYISATPVALSNERQANVGQLSPAEIAKKRRQRARRAM